MTEIETSIMQRTLAPAEISFSEPNTGKRAIAYFGLKTISDLWKVNAYINYRIPIIPSYKNQYYQSAGLTWYFQEGTCIDISRLIYFVALEMGYTPAQIIMFNDSYTIGHALTVVCDGTSCYAIDFNEQIKFEGYPMSKINSILPQIGTFVLDYQNFVPTHAYFVKYDPSNPYNILTFNDLSPYIATLAPIQFPISTYPESLNILDTSIPIYITIGLLALMLFFH